MVAGRVGPILVLIVGIIFLIHGIITILVIPYFTHALYELLCGIIAILGIYLGLKRRVYARFLCLIAGILGVAGLIIPFPSHESYGILYLLSYYISSYYLDYIFAFLFFIGGLLSVASEERFLNYYLEKRDLKTSVKDVGEELDKIDDLENDLENFLKQKLLSDWDKIKITFNAYKAGELEKSVFIEIAVKNLGNKFLNIFCKSPIRDFKSVKK